MKKHCLCAVDHDYFTIVSILSLSVWSLAPPITDGSESGPLEHFKIPYYGNPVLQHRFHPFVSHLLYSVHQKAHTKLGDVDAVEVVCSECSIAFGALPLASVVASLQAFIAEDVETLGEDSLLISGITTGTT